MGGEISTISLILRSLLFSQASANDESNWPKEEDRLTKPLYNLEYSMEENVGLPRCNIVKGLHIDVVEI
jgi:hypothetical protein